MEIKIETIKPIRVAFMRHTGPYDSCGPTWGKLCAFLGPKGKWACRPCPADASP